MTHKIDPDEAIAILEELADHLRTEHHGWDIIHGDEMSNRILAAVKPKGPWPLVLGRPNESLTVYAPDGMNTAPLAINEDVKIARADICEADMDRLVVVWLQHRGVDLGAVVDADFQDYFISAKNRAAMKAILDNAEAQ